MTNATPVQAHEAGKKAKTEGKHALRDNPYSIRHHLWEYWLEGFEGKPLSYGQVDPRA